MDYIKISEDGIKLFSKESKKTIKYVLYRASMQLTKIDDLKYITLKNGEGLKFQIDKTHECKNYWKINSDAVYRFSLELKKTELHIFFYLILKLDFLNDTYNEFRFNKLLKEEICDKCKCSIASVNKAIKVYIEKGILFKVKRGSYFFNPNIAYKGYTLHVIWAWINYFDRASLFDQRFKSSLENVWGLKEFKCSYYDYKFYSNSEVRCKEFTSLIRMREELIEELERIAVDLTRQTENSFEELLGVNKDRENKCLVIKQKNEEFAKLFNKRE